MVGLINTEVNDKNSNYILWTFLFSENSSYRIIHKSANNETCLINKCMLYKICFLYPFVEIKFVPSSDPILPSHISTFGRTENVLLRSNSVLLAKEEGYNSM